MGERLLTEGPAIERSRAMLAWHVLEIESQFSWAGMSQRGEEELRGAGTEVTGRPWVLLWLGGEALGGIGAAEPQDQLGCWVQNKQRG